MRDITGRLPWVTDLDQARAFTVISDAVWWVTIVDGTLVRYHPDVYDRELRSRPEPEQRVIEETLAGLRFVRNQMGHDVDHVDFIRPRRMPPGAVPGHVRDWTWNEVPEPTCASLSSRGQEWERARYHSYRSRLAGHPVGPTFRRATDFLLNAAALATPIANAGVLD